MDLGILVLLASMCRIAVPYVFAAVGGFYSERGRQGSGRYRPPGWVWRRPWGLVP